MTNPLTKITNKIGIDAQAIVWGLLAFSFTHIAGTAAAENYLTANGFSTDNENNLTFVYTVQRDILPWVAFGNGVLACIASASKKPTKKTIIECLDSAYAKGDIGFAAYDAAIAEVLSPDE